MVGNPLETHWKPSKPKTFTSAEYKIKKIESNNGVFQYAAMAKMEGDWWFLQATTLGVQLASYPTHKYPKMEDAKNDIERHKKNDKEEFNRTEKVFTYIEVE